MQGSPEQVQLVDTGEDHWGWQQGLQGVRSQAEAEAAAPEHQAARTPLRGVLGLHPYPQVSLARRPGVGKATPPPTGSWALSVLWPAPGPQQGSWEAPPRAALQQGGVGGPPRGRWAPEARAQACPLSMGCAPVDRGAAAAGRPQAQGPPRRLPAPTWRTTPMTGRLRVRPGAGAGHWSISLQTVDTGSWRQRPGLEEAAQQSHREPQPGGLSGPAAPAGRSPASRQGASLSKNSGATRPSSAWNSRTKGRRDSSTSDCRDPGPVRRRPSLWGARLSRAAGAGRPTGFLGWLSQEQPDEGLEDHHHSRASWSPGLWERHVAKILGGSPWDSSAFCSGS